MGLSSSSDKWDRYSDFIIESCEFAKKIVDDILIWAPSLDKLEQRIIQILERCATINVTISIKRESEQGRKELRRRYFWNYECYLIVTGFYVSVNYPCIIWCVEGAPPWSRSGAIWEKLI